MEKSGFFARVRSWFTTNRIIAIVTVAALIGAGTWVYVATRPAISCSDGVLNTPESMTTAECETLRTLFEVNTDYDTDRVPEYKGFLPRAMRDWPTEPNPCLWTSVQCSGGHLTELAIHDRTHYSSFVVPPEIGNLDHLQRLALDANGFGGFPEELKKLTALTSLTVRGNFWSSGSSLVESIAAMVELESLDIVPTVVRNFPEQLAPVLPQLARLKNLALRAPAEIPEELFGLAQLTSLQLIGPGVVDDTNRASLSELPTRLTELTELTELSIAGNSVSAIPSQLANLTNLTSLDLSHNELTSFPTAVTSLTNLRSLNLAGNGLTSVDPEVGGLTALESLDVSSNALTALPPELAKAPTLVDLALGRNPFGSVPPVVYDINPTRLDLEVVELTEFHIEPGQLSKLSDLNLSGNQLDSPPSGLSQLPSLTRLDLSAISVSELPDDFAQLASLEYLDITRNFFTDGDALLPFTERPGYEERIKVADTCLSSANPKIQKMIADANPTPWVPSCSETGAK